MPHQHGTARPDAVLWASAPGMELAGGPQGIQAEACRHIAAEQMDNTFYIVDLGNVTRMFKVNAHP